MKDIVVLISTYNGEKYLKEQIDSILNQSIHTDILVRDDGSQDNTVTILEEYANKYSCFSYCIGNNVGVVGSYLELMKMSHGYKYYAFSDQDDVWFSDKLEKAVNKLDKMDAKKPCLYASCSLIVNNDMEGEETTQFDRRGINFYNIIIQNLMPGHSQVMNQALLDFVLSHPFDEKRIFIHDYWLALLAITFGDFYFDNTYHTYYRQHEGNVLGYGHGKYNWITERIDHVKHGAARQITRQDQFFYDTFKEKLKKEEKQELAGLLESQKNFITRIKYLKNARVYRQRKFETILFYVLYLFGGYKLNEK